MTTIPNLASLRHFDFAHEMLGEMKFAPAARYDKQVGVTFGVSCAPQIVLRATAMQSSQKTEV